MVAIVITPTIHPTRSATSSSEAPLALKPTAEADTSDANQTAQGSHRWSRCTMRVLASIHPDVPKFFAPDPGLVPMITLSAAVGTASSRMTSV